ncbi:hypothetical protein CLOP_g12198 [Closterium sp. NIES-67]|nr:hypothetical protein CLOP_g12198 [Closterium sp. NIES-67]
MARSLAAVLRVVKPEPRMHAAPAAAACCTPRRLPTLLLVNPLLLLVVVLLLLSAVSPLHAQTQSFRILTFFNASQGAVLAEVQREWGVSWSQWGEGGDCSQAQGLACDAQGRIVSMYLPGARLQGRVPSATGRLTALTMLDLSSNSLSGSLPSSLGLLHHLAYLDVSDNNLNGSLPASLSALSTLSHLNVSFNLHYLGDSNGISASDLSPLLRLSSLSVL